MLCFVCRLSTAFTRKNRIITTFCVFLSSGVSCSSSWKPALTALTTTDRLISLPVYWLNHAASISSEWPICTFLLAIRCFSSLVNKILLTFRDMAIATHTCNCACYSWAISIHFYSLHESKIKRHALQLTRKNRVESLDDFQMICHLHSVTECLHYVTVCKHSVT